MVVIASFLKHAVTSLDAISILSCEGATLSCYPHIRSLFEIHLYMRWIFQQDYETRGSAYYVWDIRRKRYWLRCYLNGTPEYTANAQHMAGTPGADGSIPHSQAELQAAVDHEDNRLNSAEFTSINAQFEQRISPSRKDVEWYKPFGASSLRDMAISLGDEGAYKVFYTQYSRATHGLSFEHQVDVNAGEGEIVFSHLRTLKSLDEVYRMTFNFAIQIFRTTLDRYRPGEMDAFNLKYETEWRDGFLSIPTVESRNGSLVITPRTHQG